jgi:hypothetical protein
MSDSPIPAEKPVNDGGNAPQPQQPTDESAADAEETQEAGQ